MTVSRETFCGLDSDTSGGTTCERRLATAHSSNLVKMQSILGIDPQSF